MAVTALHAQVDAEGKADRYHAMLLKKPENAVVFGRFVDAWLETGEMAGLKTFLEEKAKAGKSEDWRLLAVFRSHSGDEVGAIAALDEALKAMPDDASVRLARAKAAGNALRFDQALKDLDLAVKDPALALEAGTLRGKFLARSGRSDLAVKAWKEVIAAHPNDQGLVEDLIDLEIGEGMMEEAVATARELAEKTADPYQKALRRLRVAQILAQAGKKEDSLKELREVFAVSAEDSWLEREVLAQVGGIFGREEDTGGLKEFYNKLREDYPRRVGVKKEAAKSLMASGEENEAIEMFREVLKVLPGNREVREEFISMLEGASRHADAAAEISALLATAENDAVLWERLAAAQKLLNDEQGVKRAIDKAVALAPADEGGKVGISRIYERFERKEEAEKTLRDAVKTYGLAGEAGEALTALLIKSKPDEAVALWKEMGKGADRENLLRISRSLSANGKSEEAYALLKGRAEEMKEDPLFLSALCQAAQLAGKSDECVPMVLELVRRSKSAGDLEAAVKLASAIISRTEDPKKSTDELAAIGNPTVQELCLLAELRELEGDSIESGRVLKKAMAMEEGQLAAGQRVRLHEMRGDLAEAVVAVREWLAMPGGLKPAQMKKLVDLLEKSGELKQALAETENWKRIAPGDQQAWLRRVEIFLSEGQPDMAVAELRRASAKFGGTEEMKGKLVTAYTEAGMSKEAWQLLSSLYDEAESPASKVKWAGSLAELAKTEGREEDLISNFGKRARENPTSIAPSLALAEIYRTWQQPDEELKAVSEASRRKPDDVSLLNRLADLEETNGEVEKAEALIRTAVRLQNTPDSRRRLTAFRLRNGDDSAVIEEVAGSQGGSPRETEKLAMSLVRSNNWDGIVKMLGPDAAANPADWRLGYLHAAALRENGSKEEAFAEFVRLLEADGDLPNVGSLIQPQQVDWLKDETGTVRPASLFPFLRQIALTYRNKNGNYIRFGNSTDPIALPGTADEVRWMAFAQAVSMVEDSDAAVKQSMIDRLVSTRIEDLEKIKQLVLLDHKELRELLMSDKAQPFHFRWYWGVLRYSNYVEGGGNDPELSLRLIEVAKESDPMLALSAMSSLPLAGKNALGIENARKLCDGISKLPQDAKLRFVGSLLSLAQATDEQVGADVRKQAEDMFSEIAGTMKDSRYEWYRSRLALTWMRQGKFEEAVAALNKQYAMPKRQNRQAAQTHRGYAYGYDNNPLSFEQVVMESVGNAIAQEFGRKQEPKKNENQAKLLKMLGEAEAEEVGQTVEPINLEELVKWAPKIDDPIFRIYILHTAGKTKEVAGEIEALAKGDDGESLRLVAAYYQTEVNDPAKAFTALAKAREFPKSAELNERIDTQLVMLGVTLAEKPPVTVDLEPAKRAALRLRKMMATEEQWKSSLVDSMNKLGLVEESARYAEGPKLASRNAAMMGRQRSPMSRQQDVYEAVSKLAGSGNKEAAAKRLFSELVRSDNNNQNDPSRKQRWYQLIESLRLKEELLVVAKPVEGTSFGRKKEYANLLLNLRKQDEALALLRALAKERPDDVEVNSTLFTVLPAQEQKEAAEKLAFGMPNEDKLAIWLARILGDNGRTDGGVDDTLRSLEAFVVFFEKLEPSVKADRNLSWVNYHAATMFRYDRGGGNQPRLRPLWNEGRDGQNTKYDEDRSKLRFALTRRLFEGMLRQPQTAIQGFYLLSATKVPLGISDEDLDKAALAAISASSREVAMDPNARQYGNRSYALWMWRTAGGGGRGNGGPPKQGLEPTAYIAKRAAAGVVLDPYSEKFLSELKAVDADRAKIIDKAVEICKSPGVAALNKWLVEAKDSDKDMISQLEWILKVALFRNRNDVLQPAIARAADVMQTNSRDYYAKADLSETVAMSISGSPNLEARVAALKAVVSRLLGPEDTWPLFSKIDWQNQYGGSGPRNLGQRIQAFQMFRNAFQEDVVGSIAMGRFLTENGLVSVGHSGNPNFLTYSHNGEPVAQANAWLEAGLFEFGPAPVMKTSSGASMLEEARKMLQNNEQQAKAAGELLMKAEGSNKVWARLMAAKLLGKPDEVMGEIAKEMPAITKWPEDAKRDLGMLVGSWFPTAVKKTEGPLRKLLESSLKEKDAEGRKLAEDYLANGFPNTLHPFQIHETVAPLIVRIVDDPELSVKLWLKALEHVRKSQQQSFSSYNGFPMKIDAMIHGQILEEVFSSDVPFGNVAEIIARLERAGSGMGLSKSGNPEYHLREGLENEINRRKTDLVQLKEVSKLKEAVRPHAGFLLTLGKEVSPEAQGTLIGMLAYYYGSVSLGDGNMGDLVSWIRDELTKTQPDLATALLCTMRMNRVGQNSSLDMKLVHESFAAFLANGKVSPEWKMFSVIGFMDRNVGGRLLKDPASAKAFAQLMGNYIKDTPQWASSDMIDGLLSLAGSEALTKEDAAFVLDQYRSKPPELSAQNNSGDTSRKVNRLKFLLALKGQNRETLSEAVRAGGPTLRGNLGDSIKLWQAGDGEAAVLLLARPGEYHRGTYWMFRNDDKSKQPIPAFSKEIEQALPKWLATIEDPGQRFRIECVISSARDAEGEMAPTRSRRDRIAALADRFKAEAPQAKAARSETLLALGEEMMVVDKVKDEFVAASRGRDYGAMIASRRNDNGEYEDEESYLTEGLVRRGLRLQIEENGDGGPLLDHIRSLASRRAGNEQYAMSGPLSGLGRWYTAYYLLRMADLPQERRNEELAKAVDMAKILLSFQHRDCNTGAVSLLIGAHALAGKGADLDAVLAALPAEDKGRYESMRNYKLQWAFNFYGASDLVIPEYSARRKALFKALVSDPGTMNREIKHVSDISSLLDSKLLLKEEGIEVLGTLPADHPRRAEFVCHRGALLGWHIGDKDGALKGFEDAEAIARAANDEKTLALIITTRAWYLKDKLQDNEGAVALAKTVTNADTLPQREKERLEKLLAEPKKK